MVYDALKLKKEEFTQRAKIPFTLLFLHRSMLVLFFFVLKCVNLHEEIDLSLSNDKDAIRLKEIRF